MDNGAVIEPERAVDCGRTAADIAREIELSGSACLNAVVNPDWLDTARRHVAEMAADAGHEALLKGSDAEQVPFVAEFLADPRLRDLLEAVVRETAPGADTADRGIECALRVINGHDPQERPLWFHYDASVVTMVVPIVIPDAEPGQCGELALCPNRRPHRSWVLTNIIEKMVVQSDVYRRPFLRRLNWDRDTDMLALTPGNGYLFWGYRTYHAIMPCAPGSIRATLVLHYKNVHGDSRFLQRAKTFRRLIQAT